MLRELYIFVIMKLILAGICLLSVIAVVVGKGHGGHDKPGGHHDDEFMEEYYGEDWREWETCYYTDDSNQKQFRCRSCCGDEGDQYCCDDNYYDSHEDDDHGKRGGHHKVVIVIIVGCLAGVVFMVVSISCCVFYMKYKKQQSAQTHSNNFSGVVIPTAPATQSAMGAYSVPTMSPDEKKGPLPNADVYTGQNKDNFNINAMLSAPPPYSTKY